MNTFGLLVKRNIRLFLKDKGMFFTSLITPIILLVLYGTFLGNVYRDAITGSFPQGMTPDKELIDGFVAGQLLSSLLAVSCITVAFCANVLMVQDKANGVIRDFRISPVSSSKLAASYFAATMTVTLVICYLALFAGLLYVRSQGWYMSGSDILCMILDIFLTVSLGTALSSCIHHFLSTQGQISAVSSIVSAGYGFICGAYMPISSFSEGLQKAVSWLPGTYATALLRSHSLRGPIKAMKDEGYPAEFFDGIKKSVDMEISFHDHIVTVSQMYAIVVITTAVLLALYIGLCILDKRKETSR